MTKKNIGCSVFTLIAAFALTACASVAEAPAAESGTKSVIENEEIEENEEFTSLDESGEDDTLSEEANSEESGEEEEFEEYVSSGNQSNPRKLRKVIGESSRDSSQQPFEEKPYVYIENPSWEYYTDANLENKLAAEGKEKKDLIFYSLEELSKKKNTVIDVYEWFLDVGCDVISEYSMGDENYTYELLYGEGSDIENSSHILRAYDALSGEEAFTIDLDDFMRNYEYMNDDWEYTEQHIFWAQSVDDILYISIGHSTYASSCPYTAYIMAIDLSDDFKVLWKSEPLVSNSDNFVVVGDTIFTGYGFTREDDYMYELNRFTGEVFDKWPVDSAIDYFFEKNDVLYVRTYDTNYTFELEELR